MKIKCTRESLLNACGLVGQAVAARTTKPILSCIKAIAEGDSLTLMATDLEIGIRYQLRGIDASRTGAAILPVTKLVSILRESSDAEITLDSTPDGTTIRTARGRFTMPSGNPDDFPDIPEFDESKCHEVTAGVLRKMIQRTVFAADKKESAGRFAVTGILWEFEPDKVRMTATDTRRIALIESPAKTGEGLVALEKFLLPQKAVGILERSLSDDGERIRIAMTQQEAMFQTERAMIHTRLIEGKFPPCDRVVPKKFSVKVELATADFLSCIRQAAIMTDEETRRVEFKFSNHRLTMNAAGADIGSSEIELDLPNYEDDDVSICFDPKYLTEMLKAVEGEPKIDFHMNDHATPAAFRIGSDYLYLIIPIVTS